MNGTDDQYESSVGDAMTVSEAAEVVEHILETDIVPFLWGPPGVGKSSVIKQICEKKNWKMIDFRLSTVNPVDLMGVPNIDHAAGVARWFRPDFLPSEDSMERGVLFLDELNLAPLSVQAAAYQLILDKRVGDYRFPKTWRMVAAGNRETDQANVYKISAPLANRFMHITVQPDIKAWVKWARKNTINEVIISFLTIRKAHLFKMPNSGERAFPTPRSWSYVSNFIDAFDFKPGNPPSRGFEMAVRGAIGDAVGQEFLKFASDKSLAKTGELVERFIQTGEITLPKPGTHASLSSRFAIAHAIVAAYKSRKIDRTRFEDFLTHLIAEERAVIRAALAEGTKHESLNESYTFLDADLSSTSGSVFVNNTDAFKDKEGLAEIISPDGKERETVSYKVQKGSKGISIERGQSGTSPKEFLAGSYIKPL